MRTHTHSQPQPGLGTLPVAPQGPEWPAKTRGNPHASTFSVRWDTATHGRTWPRTGSGSSASHRHSRTPPSTWLLLLARATHPQQGLETPQQQRLTQAPPLIWPVASSPGDADWRRWCHSAVQKRKPAQTCGCWSRPGSGRSRLARPPGASGETKSRRGWAHRGPWGCHFSGGTGRPSARGPGGRKGEVPSGPGEGSAGAKNSRDRGLRFAAGALWVSNRVFRGLCLSVGPSLISPAPLRWPRP